MSDRDAGPSLATGPRLIEVWAPWCAACRSMDADLDEVAERFDGVVRFERVNAATDRESIDRLGVTGTPTLIGLVGDEEVYRATGRHTASSLEAVFESLASRRVPDVSAKGAEATLRLAAGCAMVMAGLALGPAWPLIAIGGAVLVSGVHPHIARRSRADRS